MTAETGSECAGRVRMQRPVFTSQIRTDSSKEPDDSVRCRTKVDAKNVVAVTAQGFQLGAIGHVPKY